MTPEALLETVAAYNPRADLDLISRAFQTAASAHRGQSRASGEPYVTHPLAVAEILAHMRLDDATIVAALLHDVVEDTGYGLDRLRSVFGDEIAMLVDGLTKINQLRLVTKRAEQAENFRKLLLAITTDLRVLLVKLADRLHNMRTLDGLRDDKRQRISLETAEIYAPLAGRMGIQWLREELEELAFPWIEPEAHAMITSRLGEIFSSNADLLSLVEADLNEKLAQGGIRATISGRRKRAYSIFRKMQRRQISFDQLSDIYGFRVIVAEPGDCYQALGVVHMTWPAVMARFKDYISTPKTNGYKSIHTTVVGPGKQRVELQIRTDRMHELAQYGVAAHALYKDAPVSTDVRGSAEAQSEPTTADEVPPASPFSGWEAYDWLRRHVQTLLEGDNPEEFFEHTKLELFQDQVFCFTPKGRLITLPLGATPIDFAYAVHSEIGDACVGAKVNGHQQALSLPLRTGDEVRIITAKDHTPPLAYERMAVTGRARSAIRRAAREHMRQQWTGLGHAILEREFERREKPFAKKMLKAALNHLSQTSADEVLTAVGRGELLAADVFRAVYPKETVSEPAPPERIQRNSHIPPADKGWFSLPKIGWLKFKVAPTNTSAREGAKALTARGVPIRGVASGQTVHVADGVVPGERIVGIIMPGEGIRVYPIDSPELRDFDDISNDRWIDVTWDFEGGETVDRHRASIVVETLNEPGSLADIARLIADNDGNIDTVDMTRRAHDFTTMRIDLEVWDIKHLTAIMKGIRLLSAVHSVERYHPEPGAAAAIGQKSTVHLS